MTHPNKTQMAAMHGKATEIYLLLVLHQVANHTIKAVSRMLDSQVARRLHLRSNLHDRSQIQILVLFVPYLPSLHLPLTSLYLLFHSDNPLYLSPNSLLSRVMCLPLQHLPIVQVSPPD